MYSSSSSDRYIKAMAGEKKKNELSPLIWSEKLPVGSLPAKTASGLVVGVLMCGHDPDLLDLGYSHADIGKMLSDRKINNQDDQDAMKGGITLVCLNDMPVLMSNGYYLRMPRVSKWLQKYAEEPNAWRGLPRETKQRVGDELDAWYELTSETKKEFREQFQVQYLDVPERVHVWVLPSHAIGMGTFPSILAQYAPAARTVVSLMHTKTLSQTPNRGLTNAKSHVSISIDDAQNISVHRLQFHPSARKDPLVSTLLHFQHAPILVMKDVFHNNKPVCDFMLEQQPLIKKRIRAERAKAIASATKNKFPSPIDNLIASYSTGCKYK